MRSPAVPVVWTRPVIDAIRRIVEASMGSVILVSEEGAIQGIVTEKDIFDRVILAGRDPAAVPVREIMSAPVLTIEHTASLSSALRLMRDNKVRRLAVLKAGRLEGQINELQVLDALIFIAELD